MLAMTENDLHDLVVHVKVQANLGQILDHHQPSPLFLDWGGLWLGLPLVRVILQKIARWATLIITCVCLYFIELLCMIVNVHIDIMFQIICLLLLSINVDLGVSFQFVTISFSRDFL